MRPRSGAVAVLVALLGATLLGGCARVAAASTVEITMHYSRFSPATVSVPRGVPVTIMLRNEDPIDHEWIVGTPEVHQRHRTGTEPNHESRPTEVSVPALGTRVTTITFSDAGPLTFACHLPGHEAYGMTGTLSVVP